MLFHLIAASNGYFNRVDGRQNLHDFVVQRMLFACTGGAIETPDLFDEFGVPLNISQSNLSPVRVSPNGCWVAIQRGRETGKVIGNCIKSVWRVYRPRFTVITVIDQYKAPLRVLFG